MLKARMLLICLLMLTMPLQAMAGLSMHLSATVAMVSVLQAPATEPGEQSAGHCHDPVPADYQSVKGNTCSHCTACMSISAIGGQLAAPGMPPTIFHTPASVAAVLAVIADTPERPPRFVFA